MAASRSAIGTGGGQFTRSDTNEFNYRARSALSVDLRTQTEYGTLRSYLEVGAELTTASSSSALANVPFFDRGFIQFAGFTAGKIRSYFDINSFAPYSYSNNRVSGDTGATGIYGIAYTAQFGNGVTASLSFEDGGASVSRQQHGTAAGRGRFTVDASVATLLRTGCQILTTRARPSRTWSALCASTRPGAMRRWRRRCMTRAAAYYGASPHPNGHPGDKLGGAVTGGFTLNDVLGLKGISSACRRPTRKVRRATSPA